MSSLAPARATVLEVFDSLGPPGTPMTTSEIAEEFDVTDRTIYNRLRSLADDGVLETKKVGARGRVWWRPVENQYQPSGGESTRPESVSNDLVEISSVRSENEMARRIREFEWADTPLGPVDDWPLQLRVAVDIMLGASEAIGIYWGDDLRLLYNDAAIEQIGEKHPDALGQPARDVFPEAWDELGPIHNRVMAGEGPVRNEEYYLPLERAGELEDIWWDTSFNPIPAGDGSVGGVLNLSFDVTDRVEAERELRERKQASDEKYRTLFESIDEGFCIIEVLFNEVEQPVDYRFLETNPTFEEITDLSDAEGERVRNLVPDLEDHWFEIFGEVARTGEDVRFTEHAEHIGDRWYDVYAFRIGDPDDRKVAILFDDISERKRMEKKLRANEARLSEIFTQLPIGVGLLNADGVYELQNDRLEEIIDGDLLPSRDPEKQQEWSATDEDGEPLSPEQWPGARALRGEEVLPGIEFRLDRDGESRWFDVAAVPFDVSEEGPKALGVVQEITKRKRQEKSLRELREISTALIQEEDIKGLANRVLDAAVSIVDADFGSVQLYDSDRNDLELVANRGFTEEAESVWARITPEHGTTCGRALQTGERVIVSDIETCEFMAGTEDLDLNLKVGIRAVQTTPLVSRNGDILGMFSTHWEDQRKLTDRDLSHLDVLARQAADLIQHQQNVETLTGMNRTLERLNAASTELIDAEVDEIADRAASLTRDVLDVEYTALWQYDEEAGNLREHASHTAPSTGADEYRFPDEFSETVWQTFISDDITIRNDGEESDGQHESLLRSRVLVPLGRYGVLCAGSHRPNTFDDRLIELTETVAATIETAWNRAESQEQVATRNAELERLDQLNALIRGIDKAIVDGDSPDAIRQSVCDRLAGSELFEFAWMGERDTPSGTVVPQTWAGVDDGYLDNLTIPDEGGSTYLDPITAAIQTRELQAVGDIATDPRATPWREATLERGARSCVSIPLVYEESPFGVLTVYAKRPQPDDRGKDILAELGETISYAMAAAETRQALQSDSVTELTLEINAENDVLQALAREVGCEITFDGYVPGNRGTSRVFFTSPENASESVLAVSRDHPGIETIQMVRTDAGLTTFEAAVTDSTIAADLASNQSVIRALTATDDGTTATVDIPATLPVRDFLNTIRTSYPRTELVGRTTVERRITTRQDLQNAIADELTARQREVVEIAYRSGFFESPRLQTGRDLAEELDISQSTFTHHLREGERKVFEMVFENA